MGKYYENDKEMEKVIVIILQVRGGLGNQMFQYACVRALSLENKNEKIYLYIENFKYDDLREYSLSNLFLCDRVMIIEKSLLLRIYRKFFRVFAKITKFKEYSQQDVLKLYKLGFFQYLGNTEVIKIPTCKLPIKFFSSLFLNEQYFQEYMETIKKELLVKKQPSDENKMWIDKITNTEESVCIHIRRGDYVEKTKYLVCTSEYYHKAVNYCKEQIMKQPTFYVFSEDISYAKSLQLAKENIYYVDLNNPDYEELRLMYHCKHFVISNSTFSWWAQYLSNGKGIVISPRYWGKNDTQTSELNKKDWILL